MKVLFDAYWWVDGPPSGRNVVRTIVTTWAHRHPHDDLTIMVPKHHVAAVGRDLAKAGARARILPYARFVKVQAVAAMSTIASGRDYDAVITQNFAPLFGSSKRGVLVYDALFVTHPDWFRLRERAYLAMIRPTLTRAQSIFTISRTENERIATVWPEVRARCIPVGLGVPRSLADAKPVRPDLPQPEGTPFVLSVGRLNVRKNLARLIAAFHQFAERNDTHHLLIVGQPDGAVEDLGLPDAVAQRVHFMGYVSDAELRWLYRSADLFVLPSLDEGLGLPVLESAHEGTKVIASDVPVFRELDLAVAYFDPRSPEAIAGALHDGLAAPTPAPRPMPFTWDRTVGEMRSALLPPDAQEGLAADGVLSA